MPNTSSLERFAIHVSIRSGVACDGSFQSANNAGAPTVFTPNLVHAFFPRIVESSVRCSVATNGGIDTNALRDG